MPKNLFRLKWVKIYVKVIYFLKNIRTFFIISKLFQIQLCELVLFFLYLQIESAHVFMMRISEAVLETKILWFDLHMKDEFIQSDEITDRHLKKKLKCILYTDDEKEEISEEAKNSFCLPMMT